MSLTKATLTNVDKNIHVECLFNPNEYTIAKTNAWQQQRTSGKEVPELSFSGGQARTLTIELFFDAFEKEGADIRDEVEKLWKLARIDNDLKNRVTGQGRPPIVMFQWGGTWHFKAAITSLSVRYTLFREDGRPVRATANVTMTEAEDENDQPGTNPTSYSDPGYRRREVKPRDSLPLIAYEEYGDSGLWRNIAMANGIDDPMALSPGQVLAIPALD
jgi:hypothetical protein